MLTLINKDDENGAIDQRVVECQSLLRERRRNLKYLRVEVDGLRMDLRIVNLECKIGIRIRTEILKGKNLCAAVIFGFYRVGKY